MIQPPIMVFLAGLLKATGPVFFLWITLNFILAILAIQYEHLKPFAQDAPGMPSDIAGIFRHWYQVRRVRVMATSRDTSCIKKCAANTYQNALAACFKKFRVRQKICLLPHA